MSCIELNDVSLSMNGKLILDKISFKISNGKIHCLLGPNGAGKTMTNKLLGLIIKVDTGKILWNNQVTNPWNNEENRLNNIRKIGLMYQQPIFISTSIYKNLEYPLRIRSVPQEEREKEVLKWLEIIDLKNKQNLIPSKLSIGQQQKLALARTLISKPEMIILDEPTSSLDNTTTKWLEGFIKDLVKKESITIIWVTHNLFQVKRIAEEITLIMDGRIIETGSADKILNYPKNEITNKFVRGELI